MTSFPSEHDFHAYVDGHLDAGQREAIDQYLQHHPERAAEVRAWQRDAQRLRAAFGDLHALPDNRALHPTAIRQQRRRRQAHRRSLAAAAVLSLAIGGFGGWQARDRQSQAGAAPMADAIAAYRLMAVDRAAPPDVAPQSDAEMQAWLDTHFERATRLPDLRAAGFQAVGGRLLVTDQGPAAMVLYKDSGGHAISFYVRPPGPRNGFLPVGQRSDEGLVAHYWSGQGYNYAMVSQDNETDQRVVVRARQRAI